MSEKIGVTWSIPPHTQAKHEILRYYLGAWFPILASPDSQRGAPPNRERRKATPVSSLALAGNPADPVLRRGACG